MKTPPSSRAPASPLVPPRFEISRNPEGTVLVSTVSPLGLEHPVMARIEGGDLMVSSAGREVFRFPDLGVIDLAWIREAPVLLISLVHKGSPCAWRMELVKDPTCH